MSESLHKRDVRQRKFRAEKPGWSTAKNAAWNAKNPAKRAAHRKVEYALQTGQLTRQPCARCGITDLVHAHHDDYAHPLSVTWLCALHHKERHRELDQGAAPMIVQVPARDVERSSKRALPRGVYLQRSGNYRVSIHCHGKPIGVGNFKTLEEATAAAKEARAKAKTSPPTLPPGVDAPGGPFEVVGVAKDRVCCIATQSAEPLCVTKGGIIPTTYGLVQC